LPRLLFGLSVPLIFRSGGFSVGRSGRNRETGMIARTTKVQQVFTENNCDHFSSEAATV
jgi:hypothetical protein